MAETIGNLGNTADALVQNAMDQGSLTPTSQTGISSFDVLGNSILTSGSNKIDLSIPGTLSNDAILTGNENLTILGNDSGNRLVGNDGNNLIDSGDGDNQISTGAGVDTLILGAGNDVVEVDGGGNKLVEGNLTGGNNLIIIKPAVTSEDASNTLLTKLKVGDRVRVEGIKDENGDGKLGLEDIDGISADEGGNAVFTLKDGSSFTLAGVSVDSAVNGDIAFDITDNGNGSFDVVLKASTDMN